MIPDPSTNPRFFLLQIDDVVQAADEYYDVANSKWVQVPPADVDLQVVDIERRGSIRRRNVNFTQVNTDSVVDSKQQIRKVLRFDLVPAKYTRHLAMRSRRPGASRCLAAVFNSKREKWLQCCGITADESEFCVDHTRNLAKYGKLTWKQAAKQVDMVVD